VVLKGDILYIYSLDRFGRNKEEILKEWNDITKNIQADIVVLDMPLLDTTQFKDSLGTFHCRFSFANSFLDGGRRTG
jgi:DNA invertase Pin-like site-specific DNA recombinase